MSARFSINHYMRKKQPFQSVNIMIQMEYCKGQSLEKYLRHRNRSSEEGGFWDKATKTGLIDRRQNLSIFSQVVNGMHEMHKANVIHRDLKPENIFIDFSRSGKVSAKIGDFGLARMLPNG